MTRELLQERDRILMEFENVLPSEIEKRSFEIIESELPHDIEKRLNRLLNVLFTQPPILIILTICVFGKRG